GRRESNNLPKRQEVSRGTHLPVDCRCDFHAEAQRRDNKRRLLNCSPTFSVPERENLLPDVKIAPGSDTRPKSDRHLHGQPHKPLNGCTCVMSGRVFLGRYETIRLLGEGGMGKVYLAHQTDLGRQVVVKVMHDHIAADATFRERFQRETLLMARFQHPYAITVYDASLNDPHGPCIVMEYIRGV